MQEEKQKLKQNSRASLYFLQFMLENISPIAISLPKNIYSNIVDFLLSQLFWFHSVFSLFLAKIALWNWNKNRFASIKI